MRLSHRLLTAGLVAGAVMGLASSALATWPTNGRKVLANAGIQASIPAADGFGGGYLVFVDKQAPQPTVENLFMQHVMPNGELDGSWPVRGRRLTSGLAGQRGPALYADENGGWLIYFQDSVATGTERVKLLRVSSSGAPIAGWPAEGVFASPVAADAAQSEVNLTPVPDGTGGIFVFWSKQDSPTEASSDLNIYGWRYTSSGSLASGWGASGKLVLNAAHDQRDLVGTWDGVGGAILAWTDTRNDSLSTQIFATRLNGSGNVVSPWPAGGAPVITGPGYATDYASMVPDGAGGAVLGWEQDLSIRAERLSASGATLWPSSVNGFLVASTSENEPYPQMIPDGAGGALFGWSDYRAGFLSQVAPDIYGARVDATPSNKFALNGSVVSADSSFEYLSGLVPSAGNGALYIWNSTKIVGVDPVTKIRAQRMSGLGVPQWAGGVDICNSGSVLFGFSSSDGTNGALVAWLDTRDDPDTAIYMARIAANGTTGPAAVTVSTLAAQPSPGGVDLQWSAYLDGPATFQVYRAATREGPYAAVGGEIAGTSAQHEFSFHDVDVAPGASYYYQLAWRQQGDWQRSSPVGVVSGAAAFALRPIRQNPARGSVEVEYQVSRPGLATLEVCDLSGRRVRTLAARKFLPGVGSVRWDGRSEEGRELPSGMYFVRYSSGEGGAVQRFIWMR